MSGHSKWASIKHKKAATDARRGKVFTKLIKEITIAARNGGDPNMNPSLRTAIDRAKAENMPSDNIDRAIKKGTGELPGVSYEQVTYEGYGPGGTAIIVDALTDNKNRTTAEIRTIFSKRGGNLAGSGAVAFQFHKKGFLIVKKESIEEDRLMSIVLDAGAEDMSVEDDSFEVVTDPKDFEKVKKALDDNKIKYEGAEITLLPSTTVKVTGDKAKQVLGLMEELEDHDDIQRVYSNFDIPDDVLKELEK